MIEIGPNLLEVLNKVIKELKHNNPTCQEILSEFEIMERLITNIYLSEQEQDRSKGKNKDNNYNTYPTESGYYWLEDLKFPNDIDQYEICYFDLEAGTLQLCCDEEVYNLHELGVISSLQYRFLQPITPITP